MCLYKMKKEVVFAALLALLLYVGCLGQGLPTPKEVIELSNPKLTIREVDQKNNIVRIEYSFAIKNKGEDDLDEVVLYDFDTPLDIRMYKDEFVLHGLKSGESRNLKFKVDVLGALPLTQEREWKIDFSIKIVKGGSYTASSGFFYVIRLYPT